MVFYITNPGNGGLDSAMGMHSVGGGGGGGVADDDMGHWNNIAKQPVEHRGIN